MRGLLIRLSLLIGLSLALPVRAAEVPFAGTLEIIASVGTDPYDFRLLSVPVAGQADVSGDVVRIGAGQINAAIPAISGFGGTLVNGPGTFSAGGAGAGSTCPLVALQEVCIDGGGFGGGMRLSGVTQLGQPLAVWGLSGTIAGQTASGVPRDEQGRLWTQGHASAWYYIYEIDATPFAVMSSGTFRGLPGTAAGDAGFSLVVPMIVHAHNGSSLRNARAIARLRVDFVPRAVPLGAVGLLGAALVALGIFYARTGRYATLRTQGGSAK